MNVFPDRTFVRRWAVRIALVWFAIFYARVAWVSRDEHRRALDAERRGVAYEAIAHHRRAVRHAAFPFDASSASVSALFAIADRAEAARDLATELSALRAVRGSIVASRWILPRRNDALDRANRRIADVVSRIDRSPEFRELDRASVASTHRRQLENEPHERVVGVMLAVLGFLAFVHAATRLLGENVRVDDSWDVPEAKKTLVRLGVAFVIFVVGLVVT